MFDFLEKLIVEFPGGSVKTEWYDWIGLGVIAGSAIYGTYKIVEHAKTIKIGKDGVDVETDSE